MRRYKRLGLRTGTHPEKEKGGEEMNLEKLTAADIGDHDLSLEELRQLLQQASRGNPSTLPIGSDFCAERGSSSDIGRMGRNSM